MVSRIGLFLQIATLAFAGDYYFSYTLSTDNGIVHSEHITVSRAMTATEQKPNYIFSLASPDSAKSERDFIEADKELIVEHLLRLKTVVKSHSTTQDEIANETLTIQTTPTRVRIDFNQNFATIGVFDTAR